MQRSSLQSPKPKTDIIHLNGYKKRQSSITKRNQSLKLKIDDMLKIDYDNWRVNKNNFNALKCQTAKNTSTLQQYIKGIYIDYQIKDPLQGQNIITTSKQNYPSNPEYQSLDKQKTEIKLGRPPSPKTPKISFQQIISNRNVYITPKKSPNQTTDMRLDNSNYGMGSKVKFIQRTAPSITSQFNVNSRAIFGISTVEGSFKNDREQRLTKSRISIDNRINRNHQQQQIITKKLIKSPYTHKQEGSFLEFPSEVIFDKQINEQNLNRVLFEQQHIYHSPISQSYRYCVGCELPVLQANISHHENICIQFKNIFNINKTEQIIEEIDRKINIICEKVKKRHKEIKKTDLQQMELSSQQLIQQLSKEREILQKNDIKFNESYFKAIEVGKKWCLLAEQINKLKWFFKIRTNMVKIKQNQKKQIK